MHFPNYAESIGYSAGQKYDVEKSESESVKMLSSAAKEAGVWLLGGLFASYQYCKSSQPKTFAYRVHS